MSAGGDLTVRLELPQDWPASGLGEVATVSRQIPPATTLPRGTRVVVLAGGAARKRFFARLLGKGPRASRAVRGSALLARGYTRLGAGAADEDDAVWGYA